MTHSAPVPSTVTVNDPGSGSGSGFGSGQESPRPPYALPVPAAPRPRPSGRSRTAAANGPGASADRPGPAPVRRPSPPPGGLVPDSLTDRGNAKLFVSLYGREFRHVTGFGWHRWTGYRWELDEDEAVLWAAGEMAEALGDADPTGRFSGGALRRHRRRALSTAGMKSMLMQARAAPGMVLNAARLDADPYALCTPGGVVDLRSGDLAPPDPRHHLHCRATAVTPEPAPIPRWQRTLSDAFGDDGQGHRIIAHLHELLGYSITGEAGARVLPFPHGALDGDRSVLLDVVTRLLGDYADTVPHTLLASGSSAARPADLAELHGRRVLVCPMPDPGTGLDEARVRLLTGTDRIKARRLRQDFFSFRPTHKLWLLGAARADAVPSGRLLARRTKHVPSADFPRGAREAARLSDALVGEEGPGILHWLIAGARRYLSAPPDLPGPPGLTPPAGQAAGSGAAWLNPTARFLAECCTLGPGRRSEQTRLYSRYRRWCEEQGLSPESSRAFAAKVRKAVGLSTPKQMVLSNQRKYYPGIGMDDQDADEEAARPTAPGRSRAC